MTDIEEQIQQEFRSERFPGTLEGVQARFTARRRIRRAFAAGAVLVAAAAAVVVFAVVRTPPPKPPIIAPTPSPTATRISDADFDAGCAEEWQEFAVQRALPSPFAAQPPIRFDERSGDKRLRIYANEAAGLECFLDIDGTVISNNGTSIPVGTPMYPGEGRDLPMFLDYSVDYMSGKAIGRVSPGMTDVTAHVRGGPDVRGKIDGELFLIWQPSGPFGVSFVTARSQAATIVNWIDAFHPLADKRDATVDAYCRKRIAQLVELAAPTLPGLRSTTTVSAVKIGSEDHRMWVYRRGLLLVPCEVDASGEARVGTAIMPDAADQWRPGGHVEVMTGSNSPQVVHAFGAAPAGLSSLVLHLPDGRSVPATVKGGAFVAQWQADPGVMIEYVTATVNGVRYRVAPDGSVSLA
jgi:hypothetical protein